MSNPSGRLPIGSVHLELRLRLHGCAPIASPEGRLKLTSIGGAGCGGVADVAAVICVASQLPSYVFLFHFFMETGAWWTLSLLSTMNVRWLSCFFRIEQDSYVQSCSWGEFVLTVEHAIRA